MSYQNRYDHLDETESSIRLAQNVDEVFNFFKEEASKNEKSFLELKVLKLEEHGPIFQSPNISNSKNNNNTSNNEIAPPPIKPPLPRTLLHYCVDPAIDYTCTIQLTWNLGIDKNFFLSPLDEVRFYATDNSVMSANASGFGISGQDEKNQDGVDENSIINAYASSKKRNPVFEPVLSVSMESVVDDPSIFYSSTSSLKSTSNTNKSSSSRPSSAAFYSKLQRQQEQLSKDQFNHKNNIIEYDPSPVLPNSSQTRSGSITMKIPLSVLASSFLVCIYSAELRSRIVTHYVDHDKMILKAPSTFKGDKTTLQNNNNNNNSMFQYRIAPEILPWPLKNLIDPNADSAGACYVRCRSGKFGAVRRLDIDVALNVKNLFGFDGLNTPLGPLDSTSSVQNRRSLEDVLAFRQIVERGIVSIHKINDSSVDSDCGLVNPACVLAPLSRAVIKAYDGAPCDAIWDKTLEFGVVHFNLSCPMPIWILEELYKNNNSNQNADDDDDNTKSIPPLRDLFEVRVLIPQYFPIDMVKISPSEDTNDNQDNSEQQYLQKQRKHRLLRENFFMKPEESIHTFQRCVLRSGPMRFHQQDETQSFAKVPLGSVQIRNMESSRKRRQQQLQQTSSSTRNSSLLFSTPPPIPYFPEVSGKHSLHLRGGPAAPGQLVTAVFDLDEKLLQQSVYNNNNQENSSSGINKKSNNTQQDYSSSNSADTIFREYLAGEQSHDFLLPNVLDRIDFFTFGHTEKFHKDHARESLEYSVGVSLFYGAVRVPAPTTEGRFDIAYRSYDSGLHAPLARAVTRPPFFVRIPSASIRILTRSEVESRLYPWLYDPSSSKYGSRDDPRNQLMDWHSREEQDSYENPLNLQVADYNYSRSGTTSFMMMNRGAEAMPSAALMQQGGRESNNNNNNYLPELGLWIEVEVSFDIASKDDTISIVDSLSNELVCLIKPAESDVTFASSVERADADRLKFVDDANNGRRLREDNIIFVCRLDGKEIRPLRGCGGVYALYHSARLGTTLNRVGPFDLDDPQWALQLRTATPSILPAYQLPSLILECFSEVPVEIPLTFRLALPPEHRLRKLRKSADAGAMFGGGGRGVGEGVGTETPYQHYENESGRNSSASFFYPNNSHNNDNNNDEISNVPQQQQQSGNPLTNATSTRSRPSTPSFPHPAGLPTGESSAAPLNEESHGPLVSMKEATSSISPLPGPSQIHQMHSGEMPSRPNSANVAMETIHPSSQPLQQQQQQQQQRISAFSPVHKIQHDDGNSMSAHSDAPIRVNSPEEIDRTKSETPPPLSKQSIPNSSRLPHQGHPHQQHYSIADAEQKERDSLSFSADQLNGIDELPSLRTPRPGSAGLPIPHNLPPRRRPPSASAQKKTSPTAENNGTPTPPVSPIPPSAISSQQVQEQSNNHNKQKSVVMTSMNEDENEDEDITHNNNQQQLQQQHQKPLPPRPPQTQQQINQKPPLSSSSNNGLVLSQENPSLPQQQQQHNTTTNAKNKLVVAPLPAQQGWDLLDYLVVTVHRLSENDSLSNPVWSITPTGDADDLCSLFPGLPGASYVRPIPCGSTALTNSRHLRLEFPALRRPGRYVVRANIVLPTLPASARLQEYMYHVRYGRGNGLVLNPHEDAGQLLRSPFTLRVLCESTFRVTAANHHLTNYDQQRHKSIIDYMKSANLESRLPIFPFGNLQPKCIDEIPLALCSDLRRGENRSKDAKQNSFNGKSLAECEEEILRLTEGKKNNNNNSKNALPSCLPSSVARKRVVQKKPLVFDDEESDRVKQMAESNNNGKTKSALVNFASSSSRLTSSRDTPLAINRNPNSNNNNNNNSHEDYSPSPSAFGRTSQIDDQPIESKSNDSIHQRPQSASLYTRSSMFEPPVTTLIPFSQGVVHGFLTGPKTLTTNDCIVITSHISDPNNYKASKDDVIVIVDDEWQVVSSHRLLIDGSIRKPNNYQLCTVSLAPAHEPGQYFAVYFSVALGVGVLGYGPITIDAAAAHSPSRLTDSDMREEVDAASGIRIGDVGSASDSALSTLAQHALRSYFAKSASNPLPLALHERMMSLKRQGEKEREALQNKLKETDKEQEYYESPLRSSIGRQLVRAASRNENYSQSRPSSATSQQQRHNNINNNKDQKSSVPCRLCAHDHNLKRTGLLRALLVGCDYRSTANSTFVTTGGKSSCGSRDVDLLLHSLKQAWGDANSCVDVTVLKHSSPSSSSSSFIDPVKIASTSPTAQNIRRQLHDLIKRSRFGDSILFYFSGFGAILHGKGSTDPLRQVLVPNDVDWTAHRLIDLREVDAFARRAAAAVGPSGSVSIVLDCGFERGVFDEMDYVSSVVKGSATRNLKKPFFGDDNNNNTVAKMCATPPPSSAVGHQHNRPQSAASSGMIIDGLSPISLGRGNHDPLANMSPASVNNLITSVAAKTPRPPSAGNLLAQKQISRKTPLRGAPYSPAAYREAKEHLLQMRTDEVQRRIDDAEDDLLRQGKVKSGSIMIRIADINRDGDDDDGQNEQGMIVSPWRKTGKYRKEYIYSFFKPLPVLLEGNGLPIEVDTPSKTHAATLRQRALAQIPLGARWKSLAPPVHLRAGLCDYSSMCRRFNTRDFLELPCARFRAGGTVALTTLLPNNVSALPFSTLSGPSASNEEKNQQHHLPCESAPIAIYFAGRRAVWQRPAVSAAGGLWLDGPSASVESDNNNINNNNDDGSDDVCSVFQVALCDALHAWRMSSLRHPTADNSRVGDPPTGLTSKEREAWETAFLLAQPDRLRDFDAIARPPSWAELHKMIKRKLWSSPFRSQKPQLYVSHPRLLEDDCGMFPVECVFASTIVSKN